MTCPNQRRMGVATFWVMALSVLAVAAVADDCTLECPIDAPCTVGDSTTPTVGDDSNTSENNMHCACPPGWTGIYCDHVYESCARGEHCFHGGECVEGIVDSLGNPQMFCDCSRAVDASGVQYVGKYCETPASLYCSDDDPQHFCVHAGECNPDYPNSGLPCNCPPGFEGAHCEFKEGDVPDCTLECGGGECVIGIMSPDEMETMAHHWNMDEIERHMRCVCPPGTGGRHCEREAEKCGTGDNSHVCYHGGECITLSSVDETTGTTSTRQQCDCSVARNPLDLDLRYAGAYCQLESTDICDEDGNVDAGNYFCVNGGTCSADRDKICDCPDEFEGSRCDRPKRTDPPVEDTDGTRPDPVPCGDTLCHNGGTCIVAEDDEFCDCTTALVDGTYYAGRSCEFAATDTCNDQQKGVHFCVNGGECNSEHPAAGCLCSPAWTGLHCQYEASQDEDDMGDETSEDMVSPCGDDLNCYHGTQCIVSFNGENTHCDCSSIYDPSTDSFVSAVQVDLYYAGSQCEFQASQMCMAGGDGVGFCVNGGTCPDDPSGQQCSCLDGFSGAHCQTVVDHPTEDQNPDNDDTAIPCGTDNFCYNGGICVGTDAPDPYCDCSEAGTETQPFAGKSCEYPSTKLCSQPVPFGSNNDDLPLQFCTNHGKCRANPMDGCECTGAWTGYHCEYPMDVLDEDNPDNGEPMDDVEVCGENVCFHGSTCNEETLTCLCSSDFADGKLYAGEFCQYQSTVMCDDGSFCTNDGKCPGAGETGCSCHSGWTGDKCEIQKDLDDIPVEVEDFVSCGSNHCFFGGTCDTALVEDETVYECNCDSAFDEEARVLFDGEFCQYRSTIICREDTENFGNSDFCVNGGRCREDITLGCSCPTGYTGFRCEQKLYDNLDDAEDNYIPVGGGDANDAETEECNLQCMNDGHCIPGTKDLGDLADIVDNVDHLNDTHDDEYYEHCACQKGFTGLTCDHKVEVCGENEHFCLHGSTCVSNDGFHACDCAKADDTLNGKNKDALYAGYSCQHAATDICTTDDSTLAKPLYFCTNNGTCKGKVSSDDAFPGCDCPPDWTGTHCEIHITDELVVQRDETADRKRVAPAAIAVVVLLLCITLACSIYLCMYCRRPAEEKDQSRTCMQLRRRRKERYGESSEPHINLAPRRDSTITPFRDAPVVSPDNSIDEDDYDDDAKVLDLLDDRMTSAGWTLPPDDEPEIFIGPPRDEDGHELHNVDII